MSASDDPKASVTNVLVCPGSRSSFGGGTAAKIFPKPPSWAGMTKMAAITVT